MVSSFRSKRKIKYYTDTYVYLFVNRLIYVNFRITKSQIRGEPCKEFLTNMYDYSRDEM